MRGKVKFFDDEKGYGFITSQNEDYFVHYSKIAMPGYKTLEAGQVVEFSPEVTKKGKMAVDVKVI